MRWQPLRGRGATRRDSAEERATGPAGPTPADPPLSHEAPPFDSQAAGTEQPPAFDVAWPDWSSLGPPLVTRSATGHSLAQENARTTRPPWPWLLSAVTAVLTGLAMGVIVHDQPVTSVIGWLIGGAGAILCLAAFVAVDQDRRARYRSRYPRNRWPSFAAGLVLFATLVPISANAWAFVEWMKQR